MGRAGGAENNGSGADKNKTNYMPATAALTIADFCARHARNCDNGHTVEECVSHYTKSHNSDGTETVCANAIMTQQDRLWTSAGITKACATHPFKDDSQKPDYEACTAETDAMNSICK